uniref:RNase H type-1 domain-containing protein n=1 Tax=Cannabis sativa TaxID=3483 RepID=A0A803QN16_CANSA
MPSNLKCDILRILSVKECNSHEKHLGNPFVFKRRKREEYQFLKEKVLKRIEGWKTKLLSFAGRTTLVKSVALSMPLYALSTNKIPSSTCRELDSIIRKFWWTRGSDKDRFLALIGWDRLCSPMLSGGLGFRKIEEMNKALLAKLAWQMAGKLDRPWVKCLSKKYCKNQSFWSINAKGSDSAFWKGVLKSRDTLCQNGMSIVGRGDSIDIWRQPWIPWLEYNDFLAISKQARRRFPHLKSVVDISNEDGTWNSDILSQVFGESLGGRIKSIARLPNSEVDILVWKGGADALHIFWECHCARALWFGSPFSWAMGSVPGSANTVKGRIEWMLSSLPSDLTSHYLKFTGCLFDEVWKARNEVLFKSKLIIITEIRCSIMRRFSEAIVEVEADGQVCKIQDTRRAGGKIDAATEVLCVSDASWKDGEAGLAVGLLHIRENRVLWFVRKDKAESAAEAEMMAILWGMQLAAAKEFKSIAIASDAMVLIKALHEKRCPPL